MGWIMPKALCILFGFAVLGALVLQERQQSLELRYRAGQLHRQIQKTQAVLWRQQLQIAEYTSPQIMQSMGGVARTTLTVTKDVDAARE